MKARDDKGCADATESEKHMAFEWLRALALDETLSPSAQRMAVVALAEWHALKTTPSHVAEKPACVYRSGCETPNDCREHGYCRSPRNAAPLVGSSHNDGQHGLLSMPEPAVAALSTTPQKPRSTYVPLTEEQIEQIRLTADNGYSMDDDDWNTLCAMAESSLLYAQEIDRLRSIPSATRERAALAAIASELAAGRAAAERLP